MDNFDNNQEYRHDDSKVNHCYCNCTCDAQLNQHNDNNHSISQLNSSYKSRTDSDLDSDLDFDPDSLSNTQLMFTDTQIQNSITNKNINNRNHMRDFSNILSGVVNMRDSKQHNHDRYQKYPM